MLPILAAWTLAAMAFEPLQTPQRPQPNPAPNPAQQPVQTPPPAGNPAAQGKSKIDLI
jgi:hypothetical protein